MKRVAIVGSGGANIASLDAALDRLGAHSELTTDHDRLRRASHVILPGVGAARDAMSRLQAAGLDALLPALTQPVLGICLGMQLMASHSDEDGTPCLGLTDGVARQLAAAPDRPVPHMGWNTITKLGDSPLFEGLDDGSYFYFVHSYALPVGPQTSASCDYGATFSAAVQRGNFFGTQFHPERSAEAGARLLANFLDL